MSMLIQKRVLACSKIFPRLVLLFGILLLIASLTEATSEDVNRLIVRISPCSTSEKTPLLFPVKNLPSTGELRDCASGKALLSFNIAHEDNITYKKLIILGAVADEYFPTTDFNFQDEFPQLTYLGETLLNNNAFCYSLAEVGKLQCFPLKKGFNKHDDENISFELFLQPVYIEKNRFDVYYFDLKFDVKKPIGSVCPVALVLGSWPKSVFKTYYNVSNIDNWNLPEQINLSKFLEQPGQNIQTVNQSFTIPDGTTTQDAAGYKNEDKNFLWPAGALVLFGGNKDIFFLTKPNFGLFRYNKDYHFYLFNQNGKITAAICTAVCANKEHYALDDSSLIGAYFFITENLDFNRIEKTIFDSRLALEAKYSVVEIAPYFEKMFLLQPKIWPLNPFSMPEVVAKIKFRPVDENASEILAIRYETIEGSQTKQIFFVNSEATFEEPLLLKGDSFWYPFESYYTSIELVDFKQQFKSEIRNSPLSLSWFDKLFFNAYAITEQNKIELHFETSIWEKIRWFIFIIVLFVLAWYINRKIVFSKAEGFSLNEKISFILSGGTALLGLVGPNIISVGAIPFYLFVAFLVWKYYCKRRNLQKNKR